MPMLSTNEPFRWEGVSSLVNEVTNNVQKAFVGKREVVQLCLVAMLCRGHLLLEDKPGIGKTVLAQALAQSFTLNFRRIQFTPDLTPGDITGITIYNQHSHEFEFRPGPVLTNYLLADELNRASPRTQAALLEAMQEEQVTVDGTTYNLPVPFFVVATQNPIEYEGTFPLPEAQLDRFLMRLSVGYPDFKEEMQLLYRLQEGNPLDNLSPVATVDELLTLQQNVTEVHVDPSLREYLLKICRKTREHAHIQIGVSPRGSLALFRAAQALALISGRDFVLPDDIKAMIIPVLAHRILLKGIHNLELDAPNALLAEIACTIPVPAIGRKG